MVYFLTEKETICLLNGIIDETVNEVRLQKTVVAVSGVGRESGRFPAYRIIRDAVGCRSLKLVYDDVNRQRAGRHRGKAVFRRERGKMGKRESAEVREGSECLQSMK